MGYHQDLVGLGQTRQPLADRRRHRAANAGIHFIKNQGSDGIGFSQHHFQGQHEAGHFTTGRDLVQGPGRGSRICCYQKGNPVHARRRPGTFFQYCLLTNKPGPPQFQGLELHRDGGIKASGSRLALVRQIGCQFHIGLFGLCFFTFQFSQPRTTVLDGMQIAGQAVFQLGQIIDLNMMLAGKGAQGTPVWACPAVGNRRAKPA